MSDIASHGTLTTGLISYWNFQEASGKRYDLVGSNHLTDYNTVTSATGIQGNGADFETTNSEYLEISDASQSGLDITTDFSISVWVKLETLPSTSGEAYVFASKYNWTIGQRSYHFQLNADDTLTCAFYSPAVKYANETSNSAAVSAGDVGNWVHFVATVDISAQDIKLYKNGTLVSSTLNQNGAFTILNSTAPFTVGTYHGGYASTESMDGVLDELGIWSRALTSTEVSDLYNSGAGLPLTSAQCEFLTSAGDSSNATTYTFSSQSLGDAASDRVIVVQAAGSSTGTGGVASLTIGGVSATLIDEQATSNPADTTSMWYAEVPTGTTGDVVVTFNALNARCGIGLWRLTGVTVTPYDTGKDTDPATSGANPVASTTIDVETGGIIIASAYSSNSGTTTPPTYAWTGITENYETVAESKSVVSGGLNSSGTAATGKTITSTLTTDNSRIAMVVASWSPTAVSSTFIPRVMMF